MQFLELLFTFLYFLTDIVTEPGFVTCAARATHVQQSLLRTWRPPVLASGNESEPGMIRKRCIGQYEARFI